MLPAMPMSMRVQEPDVEMISGRIQVLRLTATNGDPWSHIVRFLLDGHDGPFPYRQFWGLKAVDTILKELRFNRSERALVYAELEKDAVSAAVFQKTLPDRLLRKLGFRQEVPHRGVPGPAQRRAQSQHRFSR